MLVKPELKRGYAERLIAVTLSPAIGNTLIVRSFINLTSIIGNSSIFKIKSRQCKKRDYDKA